jgi:phosphopantetheinyl transferase
VSPPTSSPAADSVGRAPQRGYLTPASIGPGSVHIWRAHLDAVGTQVEQLLDEPERQRADRIVREPARRRWVAARGVLRALLGGYLDEPPRGLRFALEPHGKPALVDAGGGRLHFNLSHSGWLAVCALTELCPVGIDVELVERHPGARARGREWLRAWVRREAEGKRLGVGVRNTPKETRARGPRPFIAELDLGREAVGAVALAVAPVDFRVYEIDLRALGSILALGHRDVTANGAFPTCDGAGDSITARKRLLTSP